MEKIWERPESFANAIGHFTMGFAKLEFALIYYLIIIDDPINKRVLPEYLEDTFGEKKKRITNFITKDIPNLSPRWNKIDRKIAEINLHRRHLVHGIGQSYFFSESIKTFVIKDKEIQPHNYTTKEIMELKNQIDHLLTGQDGLSGVFWDEFSKERYRILPDSKDEN